MKKILLLHGAIGSKAQLAPLSELLKEKFEVHTLNFSGHGGEDFKSSFDIQQFAQDVIAYLNKHEIPKIDIFGYSMGGYVALYLAKNNPERVCNIITLGTKFEWNPEIAARETKMLNPEVIEEKIPAFAKYQASMHHPINWKSVFNNTANMMRAMGEENPLKLNDYQGIMHSVKIGLAENDEMVSMGETQQIVNALPNATFYALANSKHPIEKVNLELLCHEILDELS